MKAVFLDRDGTINRDTGYVGRFEDFEFLPGSLEALALLQELGFSLFIITNQSGVARGFFPESQVIELNRQIEALLLRHGIRIIETRYCPHLEKGTIPEYSKSCSCRKPQPGMLLYLQEKYGIDMSASYTVGDKPRDTQAGQTAGTRTALVGPALSGESPADVPYTRYSSLLEFARHLKERRQNAPKKC